MAMEYSLLVTFQDCFLLKSVICILYYIKLILSKKEFIK